MPNVVKLEDSRGLDHVLASDHDVSTLALDTEGYNRRFGIVAIAVKVETSENLADECLYFSSFG